MVKKDTAFKKALISGGDQKITYLGPTYSGSVHVKAIADEQGF